jgi:very-short-patch-repair endonuclease
LTPIVVVKFRNPPSGNREKLAIERGHALAGLAIRQHGVVSRKQLMETGLDRGAIDWRVQTGRLRVVYRGVYAIGCLSQKGQWMAAVLACGNEAVLSHGSAAALWGVVRPRGAVDVTSAHGRSGRRRRGIHLHRTELHPEDRTERLRIPVTSVARILFDYAEMVDERRLERAWEEADRLNLLRLGEVERVCERGVGRRSLPPIRRLLAEARAVTRTRSPLEDRFASFCREHGIPSPATNVQVLGREADAFWPKRRVVVELDGFAFHRHRAAFERDRARDAALQAAGYHAIRVTHRRLDHEAPALLAELRALLRIHG